MIGRVNILRVCNFVERNGNNFGQNEYYDAVHNETALSWMEMSFRLARRLQLQLISAHA